MIHLCDIGVIATFLPWEDRWFNSEPRVVYLNLNQCDLVQTLLSNLEVRPNTGKW